MPSHGDDTSRVMYVFIPSQKKKKKRNQSTCWEKCAAALPFPSPMSVYSEKQKETAGKVSGLPKHRTYTAQCKEKSILEWMSQTDTRRGKYIKCTLNGIANNLLIISKIIYLTFLRAVEMIHKVFQ